MEYGLVAAWLVLSALLATLAFPLAARLFPRSPTRGLGLSLPIALVVLGTVGYWLGQLTFGPWTAVAGVVVLLALSAALGLDRGALRDRRLALAVEPPDRGPVVAAAAVFLAAFGLLVAIRGADPAVSALGGEKYLDFGLLRALLRAPALPPEDFWFAGEPVSYYYGGHLMASMLTMLAGVPPQYAYNLALAGFYAALVTAAFDVAAAVADARDRDPIAAGAVAAFFVGFASNAQPGTKLVLGLLPSGLRNALLPETEGETLYYSLDSLGRQFHFWDASRVIPGTINEFPLFAWLNGDMHAHMMGTPFLLLAAGLAFALVRTPVADRRRRLALLYVAIPVVGGLQVLVDTWSFPSVFGVTFLAVALLDRDPLSLVPASLAERVAPRVGDDPFHRELVDPAAALVAVGIAGGLAFLLGAHFLSGAAAERSIELLPAGERSPLWSLLAVHGVFLAVFAAHLFPRLDGDRRWPLAVGVVALAAVGFVVSIPALVLVGPLLVGAWVACRLDLPVGYEGVLIVAGAGLALVVEIVYVVEQAGPLRMNTVFKTYMQIWVLWSVAAGVAAAAMIDRPACLPSGWSPRRRNQVASVALAVVVVWTSAYGAIALASHFESHGGPETLDGTEFAERHHPQEFQAIQWLDERATTETTVMSAPASSFYPGKGNNYPPGMYRWGSSPAASLTGVPTVAGWAHEVGYRGAETYYGRVSDVDDAYTGSEARSVAVLREYDVEYVWVGPSERARYGSTLRDFGELEGVSVAFENEAVTVYRVDQEELPG